MKILSIEEARNFAKGKRTNKIVIITGVTGQDGSFMVDYLLKNTTHEIFGGARRLSVENHSNLLHLVNEPRFHLINFDLTDAHSISQTISQLNPDYFINLAAQSFVKSSWDFPVQTWDTNAKSIIHILESIKDHAPKCRFYNAGSSEEFGDVSYAPQDEKHPLRPRSPYGASKAAARQIVKVYRDSYDLYAIQGWLFNHEGTRRGEDFVTRKITKGVAHIHHAIKESRPFDILALGNLNAVRDWSDAEDMIDAIWRMLNQEDYRADMKNLPKGGPLILPSGYIYSKLVPELKEYVVANGETHSIREFVEMAFATVGIHGKWVGSGLEEKYQMMNGYVLVKIDTAFYRPAEVASLHGDATKIKTELGWSPKTTFPELVSKMVEHDLK